VKHAWLEPLTEWRILQLRVHGAENHSRKAFKERNAQIKAITKAGYNRKGTEMEEGQGTLTVSAREYLAGCLLETQALVNRMRKLSNLEPLSLISDEEILLIKNLWLKDRIERPYLIGKPLDDILELIEG
jgi:hypothetical protein